MRLEPIAGAAFAAFGAVIEAPLEAGDRIFYTSWLSSERSGMTPRLHVNRLMPARLPYRIETLERHPYSVQIFIPLEVSRYVVVVAPDAEGGGPDAAGARAFVASGNVGIAYRRGVWHAGATVLDEPGSFTVLMWRNDTADDEEFVSLEQALELS